MYLKKSSDNMDLEDKKQKLSKKLDETKIIAEEGKLKFDAKKFDLKVKYKEKKLDLKKSVNEKMFIAHIENADYKINKALEDAGNEINNVLDSVDEEFAEAVKPLELILYKADNKFEEIFLNSQLKMQKAKNELITNLENDIDRAIELSNIEKDLDDVKDKIDTVVVTLEGKIQSDKEELKQKYKK